MIWLVSGGFVVGLAGLWVVSSFTANRKLAYFPLIKFPYSSDRKQALANTGTVFYFENKTQITTDRKTFF